MSYTILLLALGGAVVNVASVVILTRKKLNSMFHNLLKILAAYDLVRACALSAFIGLFFSVQRTGQEVVQEQTKSFSSVLNFLWLKK